MPRIPSAPNPTTALGAGIIARRGDSPGRLAAAEIGINQGVLSRLESGAREPSLNTAHKLAAWLGWTMEQVFEATRQPPPPAEPLETTDPAR